MPRNDGRIEPGQKLAGAISARAWNRAQDAADRVLGAGTGFGAGGTQDSMAPYTWVYAKNNSGQDVPRWGVLQINGIATGDPGSSISATSAFESRPTVAGVAPSEIGRSAYSAWGVAIEPIRNGSVGRLAVDGLVQVSADITDTLHLAVAPIAGNVGSCRSAWAGSAQIVYRQPSVGVGMALVRIGSHSPAMFGRFSGAWAKNTYKTIELSPFAFGFEASVFNAHLSIVDAGTRLCFVAPFFGLGSSGEYRLVSVEC